MYIAPLKVLLFKKLALPFFILITSIGARYLLKNLDVNEGFYEYIDFILFMLGFIAGIYAMWIVKKYYHCPYCDFDLTRPGFYIYNHDICPNCKKKFSK